jgi:hypothetical protein
MSPLNKSDVKNHLSTHDRNGRSLHAVPSVADATGFSTEESGQAEVVRESGQQSGQVESPGRPALVPALAATPKREQS